jgi:Fur family ferric uptake transcriptional regulator
MEYEFTGGPVDHAVAVMRAKERLERWMRQNGKKQTRQRQVIVETFLVAGGHISLQELLERVQREERGIGFATVYRTMKMLTEAGVARERRFGEGQTLYELEVKGEHHDHLICTVCNHIFEYEDMIIEDRQREIGLAHGLRIVRHVHEMYGECTSPETCPRHPDNKAAVRH